MHKGKLEGSLERLSWSVPDTHPEFCSEKRRFCFSPESGSSWMEPRHRQQNQAPTAFCFGDCTQSRNYREGVDSILEFSSVVPIRIVNRAQYLLGSNSQKHHGIC